MEESEEVTKDCTGGILNICINYGSRAEIVDAVKKMTRDNVNLQNVDEDMFSKYLYQDLPPMDLLIRTSGEYRLSNFMLYQAAYAEFYFPEIYFPAFKNTDFDKAIEIYNNRDRRFGGIKENS